MPPPAGSANALFSLVEGELKQALTLFWDTAAAILDQSCVTLKPPSPAYFSLTHNFFSALFLYSFVRGGIPAKSRVYYAAANQCLRGMVTGCDNILDDEYKMTLDTDLPLPARKFRSILDIMVSDRALTAIMHEGYRAGCFSPDQVLSANIASLHALLKSGAQEAGEEEGSGPVLAPGTLLSDVHSIKTGILFQAPWALPEALGDADPALSAPLKQGLFLIGMGCQVLDDMVDLSLDLSTLRHNYVVSLIRHGEAEEEQARLDRAAAGKNVQPGDKDFLNRFPQARKQAAEKALDFLHRGLGLLFAEEHAAMVPVAVDFFFRRIGADRFPDIRP